MRNAVVIKELDYRDGSSLAVSHARFDGDAAAVLSPAASSGINIAARRR